MRIFIVYLFVYFTSFGANAKIDCRVRLQRCENRKPPLHKPVCGTDNYTYSNRCALLRVRCAQNSPLRVKHKGKCKDKQPCWLDQAKMLNKNNGKDQKVTSNYIPECLADGTYAAIQCHPSMGYCWCVTTNGRMIPHTQQANHRKLECPKRGRGNATQKGFIQDSGNSSKKSCDQTSRNVFINNLVRIFKTEYNRDVFSKRYSAPYLMNQGTNNLEDSAVQWKFSTLDKNKNKSLHKNEYRELRKLIKKVVKPRKCARTFVRLCDTDRNSILSNFEWTSCLNVTKTAIEEPTKSTTTENTKATGTEVEVENVDVAEIESIDGDPPTSVLEGSSLPLTDHTSVDDKDSDVVDCQSDRKAVLDELRTGNQEMYVPECTPDGRYKKIQCYRSTGYCWCVLEDSGKPIPGTSVKDTNPKCDLISQKHQPMKGCPDHKKTTFIQNLLDFYNRNITSPSFEGEQNQRGSHRSHEVIAALAFHSLDGNKNEMLDRQEWKVFRSMMSTTKTLQRCGKKFPRYCDSNRDNKITKNEWLQCLSLQSPISSTLSNAHVSPPNSRRRGPNPIESFLKDED